MEFNKPICLREDLEQMNLGQLNALLRTELSKERRDMDSDFVRKILTTLEGRQSSPDLKPDDTVQAAIDHYREGCEIPPKRKPNKWFLRIACAAAIAAVVLLALPRASGESLFVEFVTRIYEDVVGFFNPAQSDNRMAYEFQTDNPGLQQVYDSMVELGVTASSVPAWIPEEYKLVEIKKESGPSKYRIVARFEAEEKKIMLTYEIYGIAATHEYHRDDTPVKEYERAGIIHEIYINNEKYMVYWKQENIECSIAADCQEDSLIRILKSIYMMEEQ